MVAKSKNTRSFKNLLNPDPDFSDVFELFEDNEVRDEDIARDMNIDVEIVRRIKREWHYEDMPNSLSAFFKN